MDFTQVSASSRKGFEGMEGVLRRSAMALEWWHLGFLQEPGIKFTFALGANYPQV